MRYLQNFSILLAILLVASTLVVPTQSSEKPPFPDLAIVENAVDWMDEWKVANVGPAKQDVDNAYDDLSGLASAYKDAISSVGDVAYSSVSGAVQESWVGLLMSLYDKTKSAATSMAKTHSLQTAVEAGISYHSMELYYFDDLWNSHLRVQEDLVWAEMRTQMSDSSTQLTLSANTMMEAYYKVTFVADLYNQQVDLWNQYAYRYEPNQVRSKRYPSSPTYPTFGKFRCFGGCNYEHDTLDYARDTHKLDCGTAENIEAVARRAGFAAAHGSNRVIAGYVEATVRSELQSRDVDDGCGRPYWACNLDDREAHEKQTCSTSGCSVKYRNCLSHTKPHSSHVSSAQVPSTPTFSPASGSYTASAGDTHTANLTLSSVYSSIYWYVKSPSESGLGTSVQYVSGDGSSTSASFSYSFPSDASGDYVITAYTYLSDGSVIQPSYTVTVGSMTTTSTPSTTQTDNTPDCPWCTDGCVSCASEAPSVDPSNPDCPSCGGGNFYTCVKCGETFDTCYSHIPNCSVELPSGDFWHSSVVWW